MIRVEGVTKSYYTVKAVDTVTFSVRKGEILGFLGPNGAGKTTTMRIITSFLPPSSGHVFVDGIDTQKDSLAVRRLIGYLPENVPLYDDMRVDEYLTYRASLKGVHRRHIGSRLQFVYDRCWVGDVKHKVIGTLSKGYRQRVGLASALIHDPKILILDEPTVGLDPNQIRKVRQLIRELGTEHTILLSTHILPEVEMVCDRVVIIHQGKIVAQDTPDALAQTLLGHHQLTLDIKGPAADIKIAMESIPGVDKVIVIDEGEYARLHIHMSHDIREHIFHMIVRKQWVLREMRFDKATLEDIFVKITTEEQEVPVEQEKEIQK